MDSKNVIAAISLSAAVIILYGLFFAPDPQKIEQVQQKQNKEIIQNSEAPKLDETQEIKIISREEARFRDFSSASSMQLSFLVEVFIFQNEIH